MAIFEHDGISFHYEERGSGKPVIFLHGLGGDLNQPFSYFPQADGIRLISIDFRGHGETRYFGKTENFSFDTFASDVISLADYLGIDKFIAGGISTGAGVALNIAINYPNYVEGLILSRVAWKNEEQPVETQSVFRQISENVEEYGAAKGKEMFQNTTLYQKFAQIAPAVGSSLLGQFDYKYIEETHEKLVMIPKDAPNYSTKEWEDIEVPVLILANKIDPVHPFQFGEYLAHYIKDAVFKEIPSKSISDLEHKEKSQEYILDFLERV